VFIVAVLAYYFMLDALLALATMVAVAALLYAAESAAAKGAASGWIWVGTFFAGGWALQLVGHAFEGRKPALADNLFQIFVAPIFLVAEVFFAFGLKRDILKKIEARLAQSPSAK
jgi:uncharacterized membrane protein YGL010W